MKQNRYVFMCLALALASVPFLLSRGKDPQRALSALNTQNAPIRYEYEPGEITRLCKDAIEAAEKRLNEIAALPAKQRTIEGTLLVLENASAELGDALNPLTFMGYVSTDEKLRAEGSACDELSSQFLVTVSTRKDLYDALNGARGRDAQETRLLSETLREFEKNGLNLPADKLAQVKELKQKLAALETQFSTNLNADQSTVRFSASELAGVSPEFLARLKTSEDGQYIVTTKSTDYVQVMENATSPETRRKMLLAYTNRAAEKNVKLLEEAIPLRQRIASLMGHPSWASYRIAERMAKTPEAALKFLHGLKEKLSLRNRADLDRLLKFKRELEPKAAELKAWDTAYLSYQLMKREYSLDDDQIREYFPTDRVMATLFEIYSQIFGVRYVEVKDAAVWAKDVKLYEIRDQRSQELLAYFYADLFPRPGKYSHAAAFSLIMGRLKGEAYHRPVSAIVANYNPPTEDRPSLLNHDEVVTTFHEFGHIMHQTLTRAPYASLAGTSVARDFVEAPSQMLEYWAWSPEMLSRLSGHYKDPSRKLPAELVAKMIEAKDFNQGFRYTRQLMLALFDLTLHTASGPVDTTATYDRMHKEFFGIEALKGNHFAAGFGHLMSGYDSGYYGYLWSEVYAADMFTRFEEKGLLNSELGAQYRRTILEPGNMRDAGELLREFLGREPDSRAFFKKLGI